MPELLSELLKCSLDGDILTIPNLLRAAFQIFSPGVYIRDSYTNLKGSLEECPEPVIILCTPGIGKACFGVYLLWDSVMKGAPTLYHRLNEFYAFSSGHCYKFDRLEHFKQNKIVKQILKNKQAVLLYDFGRHQTVKFFPIVGRYVVFSSMKQSNFLEFQRQYCATTFIMPVWTEEELHNVPQSNAMDIEARFERFGGIPRQVFAKEKQRVVFERDQESAISSNFVSLLQDVSTGSISSYNQLTSYIVHAHSDPPHDEYQMKISSHYVEEKVLDKTESASLAASIQYFLSSDMRNVMQLGTFSGTLFESVVHEIIRNDHNLVLPTRPLDKPPQDGDTRRCGQVTISCNDHKTVPEIKDILEEKVYYRPRKRNNASFDSVLVEGNVAHLLLITINPTHDFNPREINALQELDLFKGKEFKFYFVVPHSIADHYKRWRSPKHKLIVDVEQYVAVLDLRKI